MTSVQGAARETRIATREAAEALIAELNVAMDEVLALLGEETALVKAGKLKAATALAERKNEKAAEYTRMMILARDEVAALGRLAPRSTEMLRRRHEVFRAEVQINLAVLATARDVAEDLLRSVATEVGTMDRPATYGRAGRPGDVVDTTMRGIAVDRNF
ncbi:flagellar protein FlgN [Chthonobacter rhizosphaerae]|uniref:flagellar protein FlgN n=1 Tax=Chthonobacter rhizosphaerae TaxID=2735553 RepID=UPI0015EF88FC|nr:flagellar protein FlgN [Chthonobacter rhizosphaerae]